MDPRKPTTMMTMTTQTRVVAKTKKPNGSTGMQRTTGNNISLFITVMMIMRIMMITMIMIMKIFTCRFI